MYGESLHIIHIYVKKSRIGKSEIRTVFKKCFEALGDKRPIDLTYSHGGFMPISW